jgi:hypothetical protein
LAAWRAWHSTHRRARWSIAPDFHACACGLLGQRRASIGHERDAMDGGGVVVAQLTMVPIAIPAAVQRRNLTALGLLCGCAVRFPA